MSTRNCEQRDHHDGIDKRADQNPRPELTETGTGVVDDQTHHGIVDCIPESGEEEQRADEGGREPGHIGGEEHDVDEDHRDREVFAQGAKSVGQFLRFGHLFLRQLGRHGGCRCTWCTRGA